MKKIFNFALLMISGYIVSSCEAISVRTDMQAVANINTVELSGEQLKIPEGKSLKYPFRIRLIDNALYP